MSDEIRIFDLDTSVLLGTVPIPGIAGTPGGLVQWGPDRLAFHTSSDQIFFVGPTHPLSVTTSGQGTVVLTPGGIDCGADCTEEFASGIEVTLTATASPGFAFDSWGGDCSGHDACVLMMDGAKSVSAAFVAIWPEVSISDASLAEGDCGSGLMDFTVAFSEPPSATVQITYQTQDGTATANSDYATASGTLTLDPGGASLPISVPVLGDLEFEGDETFTVVLIGATGAFLADDTATGTILDDEVDPAVGESVVWNAAVGVSVCGPDLTKTAPTKWGNAGASSTRGIEPSGPAYAEFTLPTDPGYAMFGLTHEDLDQSYADIDFAFYTYAATGPLLIYENGTYRRTAGSYSPGETLRITVDAGTSATGKTAHSSTRAPRLPSDPSGSTRPSTPTAPTSRVRRSEAPASSTWSPAPLRAGGVGEPRRGLRLHPGQRPHQDRADELGQRRGGLHPGVTPPEGLRRVHTPRRSRLRHVRPDPRGHDQTYADIDFAFYTYAAPDDSSSTRTAPTALRWPLLSGRHPPISVDSGTVTYWSNGVLVHTSAQSPPGPSRSTPPCTRTARCRRGHPGRGSRRRHRPPPTEAVVWRNLVGVSVSTPGNDLTKTAPPAGAMPGPPPPGDSPATATPSSRSPRTPATPCSVSHSADNDQTYTDIDFAFYTYAAAGPLLIYETADYRASVGTYAEGDTLRISVDAGVVTYWRNSVLAYTSAASPTLPLWVDTSLYSSGATVQAATLAGTLVDPPGGACGDVVVEYTGSALSPEIAGVYEEAFDCERDEGGAWIGGVDYQHCFRKEDGSAWRIWNTGCGWEYGLVDGDWQRVARTYSGLCSAIPPEGLTTLALTTTTFYDSFGNPIPGSRLAAERRGLRALIASGGEMKRSALVLVSLLGLSAAFVTLIVGSGQDGDRIGQVCVAPAPTGERDPRLEAGAEIYVHVYLDAAPGDCVSSGGLSAIPGVEPVGPGRWRVVGGFVDAPSDQPRTPDCNGGLVVATLGHLPAGAYLVESSLDPLRFDLPSPESRSCVTRHDDGSTGARE